LTDQDWDLIDGDGLITFYTNKQWATPSSCNTLSWEVAAFEYQSKSAFLSNSKKEFE